MFDLTEYIIKNIKLGCKNIGMRKSEFVAKTRFLKDSIITMKYNITYVKL